MTPMTDTQTQAERALAAYRFWMINHRLHREFGYKPDIFGMTPPQLKPIAAAINLIYPATPAVSGEPSYSNFSSN